MFDIFIGTQENKMDGKGRLSIPSDFRKVIDAGHPGREPGSPAGFVLMFGDERTKYLTGMTAEQFKAVQIQILSWDAGDPRRIDLEKAVFEQTQAMYLDETGRIVLPPRGREKLGIAANDMVMFAGRGDKFRMWNPADYAEANARPAAAPELNYDPNRDPLENLAGARPKLIEI